MIINSQSLAAISTGFSTAFNKGFTAVDPVYNKICMMTKSSGSDEAYAWLGQLPSIREWIGPRVISKLQLNGFRIENRKFESTVEVPRTAIEDDKIGAISPLFEDMGRRTAEFPDELFAELIASGFNSNCYDGQYFFDTDHPVTDASGVVTSVSNTQGGAGPAWYLLDLSRPVRPFVYQERVPFTMQRRDRDSDDNVFDEDNYLYGVRGRCNVGYGLWQLAFASKQTLDYTHYQDARAKLAKMRGDNGKLLGVRGTHLLVPAELEGEGRKLLKSQISDNAGSNPWFESAELIVSPWLA